MTAEARRSFLGSAFAELDDAAIPYAVLAGYEDHEVDPRADVDVVVPAGDLEKVRSLLVRVARRRGWVVAASDRPSPTSFRAVAIDPAAPTDHVSLTVLSHHARRHRVLVRDVALLQGRHADAHGVRVASISSRFVHLVASAALGRRSLDDVAPRLRRLRELDPAGTGRRFRTLFGRRDRQLDEWLAEPDRAVASLRALAQAGGTRDWSTLRAEVRRLIDRLLHPPGLHLTVLGPDGAGKSTLLERLPPLLAPCFADWTVFKFRPDVFHRIEPGVDPDPHGRPPRSALVSWVKLLYYFGDWWLGWFLILRPARARNAWVVFDRDFDDILVDQRRYMIQRAGFLARMLRLFLPRSDLTFVLDIDPRVARERKPELSLEEIEEQRPAYRRLAASGRRYRLVEADDTPDLVSRRVSREILTFLGRRTTPPVPVTKRVFDVVVATSATILLAPVLAAVAGAVRLKLGPPVLFTQERPGLYGRPFTVYKFRTMSDARKPDGRRRPDAERLTGFGRFLRSTSLDELPELFNVIRGEMSIVGPRPLLMEYLPRYSPEEMRRHDILPGITGWAQVHGRNLASWPEKFALDLWYLDHRSLRLDLKIIALTVRQVIKREGITQPGRATADRFYGTAGAAGTDEAGSR